MRNLIKIAKILRKFFYIFLDVSGILLGVFLTALGLWIVFGRPVSAVAGAVVLFLGISAFFIHLGHYFHLKIAKWLFGPDTYFYKDSRKTDND